MVSLGLLAPDEEEEEDDDIWYFPRKEIEENSPSRNDGISLKKETYFLRTYSTFIQDLGMRIRVPQETIATAIVFCHRFFVRRSHAKHDRFKIATSCLFLASKVEESRRPLKTFVAVSYEKIHKMGSEAVCTLFKKDWRIYEEEESVILQGEKLVLETINFDLTVNPPYKTLVEATKKFKEITDREALVQVAWNFVNDGLRTSLCLQMKPRQVAAGALFLAAKFLKIELCFDGQKAWWREFAVTPSQLEDYSNQILDLYDQYSNPLRASQSHQVKASAEESTAPSKVLANGKTACSNAGAADPPQRAYDGNQNLQDTDSEKHKIACHEIINYDHEQPVKELIITAQHITSTIDFEPKRSARTITG